VNLDEIRKSLRIDELREKVEGDAQPPPPTIDAKRDRPGGAGRNPRDRARRGPTSASPRIGIFLWFPTLFGAILLVLVALL